MYETVKTVNGYEIKRMRGTRGFYHIITREEKNFKTGHTFRSIKSATEWAAAHTR